MAETKVWEWCAEKTQYWCLGCSTGSQRASREVSAKLLSYGSMCFRWMQIHCMAPVLGVHRHVKIKAIYLLLYNVLNTEFSLVAFATLDIFVLSGYKPWTQKMSLCFLKVCWKFAACKYLNYFRIFYLRYWNVFWNCWSSFWGVPTSPKFYVKEC